jgi:hypothetical protein
VALELFRNAYVRSLLLNIPSNLPRYAEKRPWALKAAGGESVRLTSNLEPEAPLQLELPAGSDLKDLENTKIVYGALPHLTPLQARDPRLWTRLTHVDCWAYMRSRWPVERFSEDDEKAQRFLSARYFVAQSQSRALLRNGLARLWWYGYLTHDPNRTDPFELTAVLLSFLDIAQQLLERNMGRALEVRTSFLDFIRQKTDELGASSGQRRRRIRDMAKLLNLRGGVTLLDCLARDEITAMLENELQLGPAV